MLPPPPPRRAYGMHTRVPVSVYFNQYPVDTATTAHKSWDNGECRGGWTNRGGSKYSIVVYTLPSMCATYAIQQWGISLSLSLGFPIRAPSLLEKFPQPVFIAKFHERGQDCIARRGFRSRNRPWLTAGWLDFAVIPQNLAAILGRGGRGTWRWVSRGIWSSYLLWMLLVIGMGGLKGFGFSCACVEFLLIIFLFFFCIRSSEKRFLLCYFISFFFFLIRSERHECCWW